MAAFCPVRTVLSDGSRSEELESQYVSAELLPMLGVKPFRGRLFTPEDDRPNAPNVEIISYRLWQGWFGGDEKIIGRKVMVGNAPATIVGVLPPDFRFRSAANDLWEPIGLNPARDYRANSGRWMYSVARMKTGVTRNQAQAQMATVAKRLEMAYPKFDSNWTVNVELLRDSMVREVRTSLWILLGAVGLLLAVACANVANLLLARYGSRQREMAVRASLGAGRGRIVRQLLTESILLGLGGGLLGLLAAKGAVRGPAGSGRRREWPAGSRWNWTCASFSLPWRSLCSPAYSSVWRRRWSRRASGWRRLCARVAGATWVAAEVCAPFWWGRKWLFR